MTTATVTDSRYMTFVDPSVNSKKFWQITLAGTAFTVHFGRLGTLGQKQTKRFPTAAAAQNAFYKKVDEKRAKGYTDHGPVHVTGVSNSSEYYEPVSDEEMADAKATLERMMAELAE
jgi:predicted DNA-binding WGR domain protein